MLERVDKQKHNSKPSKYASKSLPKQGKRTKSAASTLRPIEILLFVFSFLGRPLWMALFQLAQLTVFTIIRLKAVLEYLPRQLNRHIGTTFLRLRKRRLVPRVFNADLNLSRTLGPVFNSLPTSLPHLDFKLSLGQALLIAIAFLISAGAGWFYFEVLLDLPPAEALVARKQPLSTQILDRNGVLLYKIYEDQNRTLVPLDQIPEITQAAFIAVEDKNFYRHHGVDLAGTARAVWRNVSSDKLEGGSTITQQLVKNALLSPRQSLERKLKEMVLAVEAEMIFTKHDLLQMYLNEVGFGGPVYGIQEASQHYFGKNVTQLSLAESALLAGLPKAPTKFSPFGSNSQLAKERQLYVLERMVAEGYITPEQARSAGQETLTFISPAISIKAPHFVQFVRELLVQQLGEDLVNQGGLQVYTTLDWQLQQQAEAAVNMELDRIKSANVSNGAALITDPKNGEILAMVGSRNYFDIDNDGQVNLTTALRQPGSAVKPINYSLAFENGLTPASIIEDQPVSFRIGTQTYTPTNYDGRFHGRVTARTALANSYNIPAVKLLAANGVSDMAALARQMGISSWGDPDRWGLSMTLGGLEVSMVELAEAYSTFANLGQVVPLKAISRVYDSSGELLNVRLCVAKPDQSSCFPEQVLKPSTAYLINNILADDDARSPAFGRNSVLNISDQQVAVKTGTSNSFRDNWTIGYTSNLLVAVWVGNNDNRPMSRVASGITGASPIWRNLVSLLLDENQPHIFPTPDSIVSLPVCLPTGTLTCDQCPQTKVEIFERGTEPTRSCSSQFKTAEADTTSVVAEDRLQIRSDRPLSQINLN
jgi:1A family penicillin-binding protein